MAIEALAHQKPCMIIGQRFTSGLVKQDPRRLQLSLKLQQYSHCYFAALQCFDTVGQATGKTSGLKTGCWFVGGDIS